MIKELDLVILTGNLPDSGLKPGDVGTVVDVGKDDYVVEFTTLTGDTIATVPILASQLRPVRPSDMSSARALA